jgi:nicotinate-nucleotide adenylyltransferase
MISTSGPLKKIGILGGTFDPPHVAHLKLATHFAKLFKLDELLIIHSGEPWQKASHITSAEIRYQLTEAAGIDLARTFLYLQIPSKIGIDRIEIERPGPSYTIDTVQALRARYGPNTSLIWLMGADSLIQLHTWDGWQDLLNYVHFAVASRPKHNIDAEINPQIAQLVSQYRTNNPADLEKSPSGHIYIDESLAIDLSSTKLRAELASPSKRDSACEQVPSHTATIISNLGLYQ